MVASRRRRATWSPLASDWHRFYIRAVDDRGGVSDPDMRYFNAQTIAPTVRLITPTGRGSTARER